jgi:hypothetical protein
VPCIRPGSVPVAGAPAGPRGPRERGSLTAPARCEQLNRLGSATMSDSHVVWWMDANSRWHQGRPPRHWWQGDDGRWYPPTSDDDPTEEVRISPPAGGVHLAGGGRWGNPVETYRDWPRWARIAAPVSAAILALGAAGAAAAAALREADSKVTAADESTITTEPENTATSPDAAAAAPTATTTVATTATTAAPTSTTRAQPDPTPNTVAPGPTSPPSTSPPPSSNGVHPGALCSPEGATALSDEGVPLTCTTQKCHGTPFNQPRWRGATC